MHRLFILNIMAHIIILPRSCVFARYFYVCTVAQRGEKLVLREIKHFLTSFFTLKYCSGTLFIYRRRLTCSSHRSFMYHDYLINWMFTQLLPLNIFLNSDLQLDLILCFGFRDLLKNFLVNFLGFLIFSNYLKKFVNNWTII